MKVIVIYQSGTGFTQQYAQWISEAFHCEAKPLKKVNAEELNNYDKIIFGGWIMGNMLMGLGKLRKLTQKKLILFATGSSNPSEQIEQSIRELNHIDQEPLFYMQSGFHYDKLSFIQKGMLNMVKKSVAKKPDKSEQDLFMQQILGTNVDFSDKKNINGLVEYVNELANGKVAR